MQYRKVWEWSRCVDSEVAETATIMTDKGWDLFSVTYIGDARSQSMMHMLFYKMVEIPESTRDSAKTAS